MIALPNYDDQNYLDIMETARRRIPVIYPQWTDMNEHDPGITLIELFAWLKEMEQYQLNQITDKGYESMLKLLGVQMQPPSPAQTTAFFSDLKAPCRLLAGTRFTTAGKTVFECENEKTIGRCKISGVYVSDHSSFNPVSDILHEKDVHFTAFGENPAEGISALYIGIDSLLPPRDAAEADLPLELYFLVYDSYPVHRNPFAAKDDTPRKLAFEYASLTEKGILSKDNVSFLPADVLLDETQALSLSGRLVLRLPKDASVLSLKPGLPECHWLRIRLVDAGCEETPRLLCIYENTAQLTQLRTRAAFKDFCCAPGSESAELVLDSHLGQKGELLCFARDTEGWGIHNDFSVLPHKGGEPRSLKLHNLPAALCPDDNIRVVCYEPEFRSTMLLRGSDGLPNQRFPVICGGLMLCDRLRVMVEEKTASGAHWQDWRYIENLDDAKPLERVFSYDRRSEAILFGDNRHGAVPGAGNDNILIVSCAVTDGGDGNILSDRLDPAEISGVTLSDCRIDPAVGGSDGDGVQSGTERLHAQLNETLKAVTAADYEELCYKTPGLRVLGAKAIPCYDPARSAFNGGESPATVTVAVMPYSESPYPKPDEHFLEAVRGHLENYRMITTELKVIPPEYIRISIFAEVVLQSGYTLQNAAERSISEIKAKIERIFDIQKETAAGKRPRFGDTVRINTLVAKITEVPGVNHVKRMKLSVRGAEGYKDKFGNIELPPYGIPYLGEFEIQTVDSV